MNRRSKIKSTYKKLKKSFKTGLKSTVTNLAQSAAVASSTTTLGSTRKDSGFSTTSTVTSISTSQQVTWVFRATFLNFMSLSSELIKHWRTNTVRHAASPPCCPLIQQPGRRTTIWTCVKCKFYVVFCRFFGHFQVRHSKCQTRAY